MDIKSISLAILFMIQCALALDVTNCTNSSEIFARTAHNPQMKFYLFTNKNFFEEQQIFSWNKTSLTNSNFNASHPTRIIVHGWKNNLRSCLLNGYIKDAYLKKGDFNVIVVDWGNWAQNTLYTRVTDFIFGKFGLGTTLGNFTKFLNKDGNITFDSMYLIGHSLGAHISGAAGKYIKPDQYNTIFGLDPAGPDFQTNGEKERLDSSDAKYVEQISTNLGGLGYNSKLGHAAFYPNFGRVQKYCLEHDIIDIACSHTAAYWYFAESINNKIGFCGNECPYYWHLYFSIKCSEEHCTNGKRILMGGEPSVPKNATYYISVNPDPPFARCSC